MRVLQCKQAEYLVEHRRCTHGGMEERAQDAHGQEELDAQKGNCQRSCKRKRTRLPVKQNNHDAHRRSAEREQIHNRYGVQLHAQQAHGCCTEAFRLLVYLVLLALVCLKQLQRGKSADRFQERCAQIDIRTPIRAHYALGYLHNCHDGNRHQRHTYQKDYRCRSIKGQQQGKQRQRRKHGVKKLRHVLPQIHLEFLGTFAANLRGLRGCHLFFIRRAQLNKLVVYLGTHLRLTRRRSLRAGVLGAHLGQETHQQRNRRNASPLGNSRTIKRTACQPGKQPRKGANEHHIGKKGHPFAQYRRHYELNRLRHQLQQSLIEQKNRPRSLKPKNQKGLKCRARAPFQGFLKNTAARAPHRSALA